MADKLLKSIKFPTLPDRYVIGDSTLTEEGAAADAKAVGDALATKADTKGTYEDLIVGGAEQLMADEYETDKEPYLFRTTGGSADVGNREYVDKIVGGTVAWNQLVNYSSRGYNNSSSAFSSDGFTFTATAQGGRVHYLVPAVKGHKYYFGASIRLTTATDDVRLSWYGALGKRFAATTNWQTVHNIIDNTFNSERNWQIQITDNRTSDWDAIQGTDVFCIDLTAMFGTTIADYIYSLEQSQSGAGVAWFRKLFPNDYYPYDPGTLRSVEGVSAHKTVGFNQWDEEWEVGALDSSGGNYSSTTEIRSKNYIPIIGGETYYLYSGVASTFNYRFYDENKVYVSGSYIGRNNTLTAPYNARYMRFYMGSAYGTTYNHDISINLSDPSRNGEYEPYQKHTYPLDSSLTLRGIPKLVDGKLAFDGDVYPPSGEVQRRYKQVTLTGSENWNLENGVSDGGGNPTSRFYIEKNDLKKPSGNANTRDYTNHMTSTIPTLKGGYVNQFDMTAIEIGVTGYQGNSGDDNYLYIIVNNTINTTITTVDALKSWLSSHPLEVVYELATPTTETADGYEQYQRCDPSGTEEFVTDSIVPVGHETRYPHDLKKKIETAPDSPSTDGTYLMKRSGGKNTYMALPSTPSANGAYVLTVTVSGGNATYSWTKKE